MIYACPTCKATTDFNGHPANAPRCKPCGEMMKRPALGDLVPNYTAPTAYEVQQSGNGSSRGRR